MSIPNQCIIIGGGASIKEGIALSLKEKIQDKFVLGINFAFHFFQPTCTLFLDNKVWSGHLMGNSNTYCDSKHIKKIRQEPLIITSTMAKIKPIPDNVIVLKQADKYTREQSKICGFYVGHLTGVFAIGVASYLMNYSGEIFLLGFDWTKSNAGEQIPTTHFYSSKEIRHKGMGMTNYYNKHDSKKVFEMFLQNHPKIYNVSSNSNIECFEKISYTTFFEKLQKAECSQNEIREEIKLTLKGE